MAGLKKILLVDDDDDLREALAEQLVATEDFDVFEAGTGAEAVEKCKGAIFDLVVLDVGLPDTDGRELCKRLRKQGVKCPIVMLTGHDTDADTILGLDSGANDYITKPFSTGELLARVRAALRLNRYGALRGGNAPAGEFRAQGMRINYDRRKVFVDEQEIKLTQTEYNIVAFLSQHAGRVMTYAAIVKAIWGDTDIGSTKKLQVNMANIRKKLGSRPGSNAYILNELGVGYRMIDEDNDTRNRENLE